MRSGEASGSELPAEPHAASSACTQRRGALRGRLCGRLDQGVGTVSFGGEQYFRDLSLAARAAQQAATH